MKKIDPAVLARVSDLQLLARTVVQGVLTGIHRSPFYGSSIEFAQYRPYVQGDDPKFVDWSLYARTDRLHVKQFHDETNLRCMVLLDCSGSMKYGSHEVNKFQYARMLAACLATVLHQQKDDAGLIGIQSGRPVYIPPRNTPNHYRRILVELANLQAEGQADLETALAELGDLLKPRGVVVFISDLLQEPEGIIEQLKVLKARKQDILVMQISDPAEQTFPFDRTVTLVDAESTAEQYMVPELVREQYLENREKHFDLIRKACLPALIDHAEYTTNEPLDRVLRYFLQQRSRILQKTRSRRYQPGERR